MATKVRLRHDGLFIAIFLCLWALTGALRYGSRSGTLHTHKASENEYMGQSVRIINGASEKDLGHHRIRRDAPLTDMSFKAAELDDSHYQMIIHWAGKDSRVIVAITRDIIPDNSSNTSLYISNDYGGTFNRKELMFNRTTPAILDRFYNSPIFNSHYIFTDVFHKVVFVTRNYVKDVFRYAIPFAPRQIAPHPKKYDILLGHDDEDPKKKLYISMNFGADWRVMQTNVKSFFWGVEGVDTDDNTLFVERSEEDGSTRLLKSTDYFRTNLEEVFGRAIDVQVVKKYIFATRGINKTNDSLELFVSVDREPFKKAEFSFNFTIRDFFIADASEDAVLICVTYNMTKTDLFVSDFSGVVYSLSLRNVLYFNPDLSGDTNWWLRAFTEPFADVHSVEGLNGIYIASVEEKIRYGSNETGLKTYITHNMGGVWFPVVPPRTDAKGRPYNCSVHAYFWPLYHSTCSLHLAQKYHSLFPQTRAVPILSKRSAVGLIMATGVVNTSMTSDLNVYLSKDGGFVWHEVMQEPHFYAFGDHGGIIVAVQQKNFTKEVLYSTDEGETWNAHPFFDEELRVYGILTEPGEKTMIFSIFGSHKSKHSWIIVQLNMTHIFNKNCTDEDYKDWSPGSTDRNDCLLGRQTVYQRRLSHVQCFNGRDYEREISVVNCPCRSDDYECDYGFENQHSWSYVCVADKDDKTDIHAIPSTCQAGHYYNRSKGYRKITGDTCKGGEDYRFDPDRIMCPMQEGREFMLYSTLTTIDQVNLADVSSGMDFAFGHLTNVKSLEFDYQENCLYWVEGRQNVIKRNCLNGTVATEIVVQENTENIESIAFDWITNNIFWLEVGSRKKIEVATTAHLDADKVNNVPLHRRVIIGEKNSSDLVNPKSLVVYPKYGYLFWAEQETNNGRIRRAWMDGQHVEDFVTKAMVVTMARPQGLTIDSQRDLLFWVDTATYEIWYTPLNSNGRMSPTRLVDNVHALYLSIFKDEVYFADYYHNSIMAVNKYHQTSHVIRRTVKNSVSSVTDLKVFSVATQHGITPCSRSNGQCSSICVERPSSVLHPMPLNRTCLCAAFYAGVQKNPGSSEETCRCPEGEVATLNTCMAPKNGTCDKGQISCANGRCIPSTWKCDRDNDCGDLTDETDCAYLSCNPLQFACGNGRCIPKHWQCDHDDDCSDGSDEGDHCSYSDCNNATQFTCDNNRCIPRRWHCDGDDDCHDGSDEHNCNITTVAPGSCSADKFRCQNGHCIVKGWVCDGDYDCVDNSDEMHCNSTQATCASYQHQCSSGECIEKIWICDGQPDCRDGSDEKNCNHTTVHPSTSCAGSFECMNKMCISFSERCDGINDCGDGSDEVGCERPPCPADHMRCNSGECLANRYKCNGNPDCADGSDESRCLTPPPSTCSPEQYHCYMGGFVRCIYQSWECDDAPDCEHGEDESNCNGTAPCDQTKNFKCLLGEGCIPKTWLCDGDPDCPDRSDEMCAIANATAPSTTCPNGGFSCGYGICIDTSKVCDGRQDCTYGEDETKCDGHGIKGVIIGATTNTSIEIEWVRADPPNPSAPYKIMAMYRTQSDTSFKNTTLHSSTDKYIKIDHLQPYTTYLVSATIVQNGNTLPPINIQSAVTDEGVPGPPVLISAAVNNGSFLEVKWKKPLRPNGELTKFEVFYEDVEHGSHGYKIVKVEKQSDSEYHLELTDLLAGYQYTFWVVAYTSLPSEPSNKRRAYYDKSAIMSCVSTDVKFDKKMATVTVTPTKDAEELQKIEGFNLFILAKDAKVEKNIMLHKSDTTYQFQFGPGMAYEIYAIATSSRTIGPICNKTSTTAPGSPKMIKKADLSHKWIDSNVYKVMFNNAYEKDKTYKVYYTTEPYLFEVVNFHKESKMKQVQVNESSVILDHLQACDEYVVRVQVVAPYYGPLSEQDAFTTSSDDMAAPENIKLETWSRGDNGFLKVSWDPSCLESQDPMSYEVRLKEIGGNEDNEPKGYTLSDAPPMRGISMTISNLHRGATYEVSLTTQVKGARSSSPETIQIAPLPGPVNLKVKLLTNGEILTWDPPSTVKKNQSYEVWQALTSDNKKEANFEKVALIPHGTTYRIPENSLHAGNYLYEVRIHNVDGGKYPSAFSDIVDFNKPSVKGSHSHQKGGHTSLTLVAIVVPCSIVVLLLSAMLTVAVMRNRRLQRSFLSYANSHYDTRSGTTTFSTSDELAEEEEPMIRGFSDDEPLVMA